MKLYSYIIIALLFLNSCGSGDSGRKAQNAGDEMDDKYSVKLITIDPGHFHAALVQKIMYDEVAPDVYVFAPEGPDYLQHIDRINSYNNRIDNPTGWNEIIYTGDDFFEKMVEEKPGNVVVLSGNNRKKAEYISKSVNEGLNVLADKPMIISPDDFPELRAAFAKASENGVLLYDIMTERYEITTILQKLLSMNETVFGTLQTGTAEDPAVSKVSVHHFSKIVSGAPLRRPAWFFDTEQQGEGIVDVTTHLVDLIQWECFSEQILDTTDIEMVSARRWPTAISKDEFQQVTGLDSFPGYLSKDVSDGSLKVFSNGEMIYKIKGIFAKVSVTWNYMAPQGGGDTHFSVMKGAKCDLVIRQGADEKFLPTLYIENIKGKNIKDFTTVLQSALSTLPYDSLRIESSGKSALKISVPSKYRVSHEEHFAQVTAKYLEYLREGKLPDWEVPGMITKYYTTTRALKKALE